MNTALRAFRELSENGAENDKTIKASEAQVNELRKLFREGHKSRLIKLGLSLIAFPEPTPISPTVGACFVATGVIQQQIKNRSIYIDDIPRTLKQIRNEIKSSREDLGL